MKKIVALALVLMGCQSLFAQSKFNLGIQASPMFTFVKSEIQDANTKVSLRFSYGLLSEFHLADNYLISTGINHSYDGGKLTTVIQDTSSTVNYSAQFVRIPMLLKMRTKEIGYMRYFALFGITTGFKVNEKVSVEDRDHLVMEDASYINFFKAELSIGLGAEYALGGNTRLLMGANFNQNFTNMVDRDESFLEPANKSNRFSNIMINVGVIF